MLYGSSILVLFYKRGSTSYSYIRWDGVMILPGFPVPWEMQRAIVRFE